MLVFILFSGTKNSIAILEEKIQYNQYIKIQDKPLGKNFDFLKQCGIIQIRDIIDKKGLMSKTNIKVKYACHIPILTYNSIISALPMKWQDKIKIKKPLSTINHNINHNNKNVSRLQSRGIYEYMTFASSMPSVVDKWVEYYPFLINLDWKKIFILQGIACNEYKLQCLQYSILHRYFYCNYNLHLWQLVDSPDCDYCHVVDNIEHFFFYCKTVHNIWNCIKRLIVQCFQINIKVTVLEVLLGIPCEKYTALHLINCIFLYAKWYIYQKKKGKI